MVTIWWDRISTVCNFNRCHFGAGNDWRGRFIRHLTLWKAFTQVSRWMGKCTWKSHWLDWEKELKSAHEPSVYMAKDFPSWATRGRGIRNWMKSTKQWGIGDPPSPSIEKHVAQKQKERARVAKFRWAFGSRLLTVRPGAIYSLCPELSLFSPTKLE